MMTPTKERAEDIERCFRLFPDKHWCLVQTRPRNEKYAQRNLSGEGILSYLPLLTKLEIHNRGKRITLLPMFPGYVFACPSLEEETLIRRCKTVWNLRKLSAVEEEILLKDLQAVRRCEQQSAECKLMVNPGLHPGDVVKIKSGTMKGQEAIVVRRENEWIIIINLFFFGRYIQMSWAADELERESPWV